jgi:hypothetical protein
MLPEEGLTERERLHRGLYDSREDEFEVFRADMTRFARLALILLVLAPAASSLQVG